MKLKSFLIIEQSKALDYLGVDNDIKTEVTLEEATELQKQGIKIGREGSAVYHYYRYAKKSDFDEDSLSKAIILKQMQDIKIIKRCMVFFTIIAAVNLIASLLAVLGL